MPSTPEPTPEEIVDALHYHMTYLRDQRVNGDNDPAYQFTYSFETSQPADLWRSYSAWTPLTNAEKAELRDAMRHIESFLNVRFVETNASDPDINLGKVFLPGPTGGIGGYSYAGSNGNLVRYDAFSVFDNAYNLSQPIFKSLILHELGHALGLKHPFEDGPTLPSEYEHSKYSLMSYTTNPETGQDGDVFAVYDVYALQERWGANTSTNTGNNIYKGPRDGTLLDTIWDAGGTDMIDARGKSAGVTIDLREGKFSRIDASDHDDLVIALNTVIENARGTDFDDTIIGNDVDNRIFGLAGDDDISGGGGNDFINGSRGNDTISGDGGNDDITGNRGNDTISGNGGADLLNGGSGRDTIYGGHSMDTILGDGGRDTLYGGAAGDTINGGAGKDFLYGGTGSDVLTGGSGQDRFIFSEGDGSDRITDFEDDLDTLLFDIDGVTTKTEALSFARQAGSDVLFEFGGGDTLRVEDVSLSIFSNDVSIV